MTKLTLDEIFGVCHQVYLASRQSQDALLLDYGANFEWASLRTLELLNPPQDPEVFRALYLREIAPPEFCKTAGLKPARLQRSRRRIIDNVGIVLCIRGLFPPSKYFEQRLHGLAKRTSP